MLKRSAAILFFLTVSFAAVAPIRSYDYFWHLAAGRWIIDAHSVPRVDPLAVASSKDEWINGEWLYEVALQSSQRTLGDGGMSVLNALLIASIFTVGFWFRKSPEAETETPAAWTAAEIGGSLLV